MRLMNALTVRGKLAFAFGCVLVLMLLLGAFSILQLSRVYAETDSILIYRLPGVRDSMRMVETANRYRTREYRTLISTEAELKSAGERMEKATADFETARKDYSDFMASDEERKLYEAAMVGWKEYVSATSQALPLMRASQYDLTVPGLEQASWVKDECEPEDNEALLLHS